ncbi:thiolase family protein [uncultured Pseudoteredinibacter sp.]|uniref:thiolase family protein n=1 Tax=uncultured Pseudoteredinibacter sp. TaxID=1641701 RepID=UPI0026211120|nr:thiolase family protein [uncultured Pseudoteredinibacter sp.]
MSSTFQNFQQAKSQPSSYQGIALVCPVSVGYAKQSEKGAAYFIGRSLGEMIQQAGIHKDDVDGLAISSFSLGPDSVISLCQHFDISPRFLEQLPFGGASGVIAMRRAARAVQMGDADIVACIGGDTNQAGSFADLIADFSTFTRDASYPYGAGGPNAAFALITQHYMEQYGATREDFGRIAIAQRYNANHYPTALLGHKTLSMDDYLNARPIAGPVHMFDCVMPCAGGEGFLMMSVERAKFLGLPYVSILAADELHHAHRDDPVQYRAGWTLYANKLYQQANIGPDDIDMLQTYDDYPVISMMQMEDLGFCAKGEAKQFVRETALTFDGNNLGYSSGNNCLPHNTSGGQLSVGQAGSAAGFLGLVESIRQLLGQAEKNQVQDARHAMVSGYGMINYDRGLCSSAAILASTTSDTAGGQ